MYIIRPVGQGPPSYLLRTHPHVDTKKAIQPCSSLSLFTEYHQVYSNSHNGVVDIYTKKGPLPFVFTPLGFHDMTIVNKLEFNSCLKYLSVQCRGNVLKLCLMVLFLTTFCHFDDALRSETLFFVSGSVS